MMNYFYLFINIATALSAAAGLFIFRKKLLPLLEPKGFIKALVLASIPFILFDIVFTHYGVWGFSKEYLTGLNIANLPIEEVLFFYCIPFACFVLYLAVKKFSPHFDLRFGIINSILVGLCFCMCIIFRDSWYPFTISLITATVISVFSLVHRNPKFWSAFYVSFFITLIPFFIVNYFLTAGFNGIPVVWYNNEETLGIRIITIPIEDMFFSFSLFLSVVGKYEHFRSDKK